MFKKIDLHVHTPESTCYIDHVVPEANLKTSALDIVEAAQAAGLDGIAIADHNSVEGIDAVRDAARGNGLVVFPGIEISCRGGHLVAVFDQAAPVARLRELLRDIGLGEKERGQGYLQTDHWLDDVAEKVDAAGGLAIAAHVDRRPKGFVSAEEDTSDKVRIHQSPHISALEITVPQNKCRWNQGQMPRYPLPRACIQGSDAHAPAEVGRRPVYVLVPALDLDGLRLAFKEFEARVRFPEEMAEEYSRQA